MQTGFERHALANGPDGEKWLKDIPNIIRDAEKRWNITVQSPFNLSYNYVAPATTANGDEVVLKIGFPKDPEFQTEIEALEVFHGEGIENLLEADREKSVILIERVTPGEPLSTRKDDEEMTRQLAKIANKLWKPLPAKHNFISIRQWTRDIPAYLEKHADGNGPLPYDLIKKANDTFDELLTTSSDEVLLHGDLHQDNILSSKRDGWLAIDPKGIAGEREYETAAMIRNPYEKMKNLSPNELEKILRSRIHILSEELGFDPIRIHKWCFAQTVLSGVWSNSGVKGSGHAMKIANVLNRLDLP